MNITRTSPLTGELNTLDLPLDRQSLHRWRNGEPARDCSTGFPPRNSSFFSPVSYPANTTFSAACLRHRRNSAR